MIKHNNFFFPVLLSIAMLLATTGKAQDSLKVYDVGVHLTNGNAPPTMISGAPTPPAPLSISATFKIDHPEDVSEIHIKIGQTQNGTEFRNETITIVNHSGILYMHSGGVDLNRFWNGGTKYEIQVTPSDMPNIIWFTIYAKDNLGNYSEIKYCKIQ